MLELKWIRENPKFLQQALINKKSSFDLDHFLELDEQRRTLLFEVEQLKNRRNMVSDDIGRMKREGGDVATSISKMKDLSTEIKTRDRCVDSLDERVKYLALLIPNIPHASVPVGFDEAYNKECSVWGTIPTYDFPIKDHQDLGEALDILDLPRGAKIAGRGFPLYKGDGARLERSLLNFMLDMHTSEHAYTEVFPPFLVNAKTMTATGQLPKMAEDMYHLPEDDLYLIPTAEVPVTNIYRQETLDEADLPKAMVAYTPCFRREAGAYGKDTRGITRVHQFDKVELVRLVHPERSYEELESLRVHAENVLQALELPYRILELCTGDLSFSATKCYDIEVWAPGQDRYLEVSSCSNFEDFQARRLALRYKPSGGGKSQLLHTLNGSGIALARTFVAILENGQDADGRIHIPKALHSYMGKKIIE
jgi:seryl-tRNA synthetase